MATYTEQLQRIANDYRTAGQKWPATKMEIAQWAIANDRWQPQPALLLNLCAEELAGAMREEIITDEQGRKVRAKHVAKMPGPDGEELYLWDDIRTATREHMRVSAQTERLQIAGWCYRLKVDVDSFNQNYNAGKAIQISFDFRTDLADMEAVDRAKLDAIKAVATAS
jgi:hypothetical protein